MKRKYRILLLILTVIVGIIIYVKTRPPIDPLYTSIEEDPCWQGDVFYIYDKRDYVRFAGYMNRAGKEDPDNDAAVRINAELMADIDLTEAAYGSLHGHPYIRQSILNYAGVFEGNGHTMIWYKNSGNGMFACLEREAAIRNLTFHADSLVWEMDEYGVGMMCMINYGTIENCRLEGSVTGTQCYTGGFAGINRGTIRDCINYADVQVKGRGDYGAGGIAGLNKCKVLDGEDEENPIVPVIQNCVNMGSVEAPWEAGGICAENDCAFIYDCGNEGDVTVQYQRGYIYPESPYSYERALAAGICGNMEWNSIENCYNAGKISILEEGEEATYGIAGNTLFWINTVENCVNLKGTARGSMRHESIMELDEEQLGQWLEDHDSIVYTANNWQFDLEEAREKLPMIPLGTEESALTKGREDAWLCEEFLWKSPEGFGIREVSPYALCMEKMERNDEPATSENGRQVWLLRLSEETADISSCLEDGMYISDDEAHRMWLHIQGSHWLHPGYSYKDDCHMWNMCMQKGERELNPSPFLVHYRDDFLAMAAVGDNGGMMDNVVSIPVAGSDGDNPRAEWILVFTNKNSNYRPSMQFVEDVMEGFCLLPGEITVQRGDTLSGIARDCLGDGMRYPELMVCNEITDADHILEGQALVVPEQWMLEP